MVSVAEIWQRRAARRGGGDAWPAAFLAVVAAASIVIVALLLVVVWLSFRTGELGAPDATYSLAHYPEIFGDAFTWHVLLNTVGFSLVTLVVALAVGAAVAWLVERSDLPGKTLVFTFMAIGLLIPGFAVAMGWLFMLHPRIGLVNTWLIDVFGLTDAPFNIATVVGMGFVQGLSLAPLAFIMTAAVFRAMDPTLEESAQMSGAGFGETFRRVTLPLAWPGVLAAGIYIFTIGFAAFDVPAIIGWSNKLFTFSTYMVLQLNPDDGLPRYGMVATMSSILLVLALFLAWWYGRMQSRMHRYQVVTGKAYRPRMVGLGRWGRWVAWGFLSLYLLLSKIMPITVLLWASLLPYFRLPSASSFAQASFSRYEKLPWGIIGKALSNTAMLMVATPTIALILSLCFSWIVLRSRVPGRASFDFIAFLPHAVPQIVFGTGALLLALFVLDAVLPLYGTVWLLLVVFVVARISYGTRMTNAGLIQIHRELEECGRISGASMGGVMRAILAPLLLPTLIYAWLWIALLTFRELTLAVVLTTGDNVTLPFVIWGLWQGGGLGDAAAGGAFMLVLMAPFVALYWIFARRIGLAAMR